MISLCLYPTHTGNKPNQYLAYKCLGPTFISKTRPASPMDQLRITPICKCANKVSKFCDRWDGFFHISQNSVTVLAIVESKGPSQYKDVMSSYQYRKSHCGDKTVVRLSYLHNEISYTGKMTSLYWIGVQSFSWWPWPLDQADLIW